MRKAVLFFFAVAVALGVFIWASDRVTLEGERTVYTVNCEQGVWNDLECTGRVTAGDRHRFRSSRSRREIVYWIAGSPSASGKFTDCEITDRDRWTCQSRVGDRPTITHEISDGRPVKSLDGIDVPFHAVTKWKWWALHWGIPVVNKADFSNSLDPRPHKLPYPDPARK
jgi:hypothetical protein